MKKEDFLSNFSTFIILFLLIFNAFILKSNMILLIFKLSNFILKTTTNVNENKENPGATLGPGPKAGPDGVKDNYYVKAFKYKLVPKNKFEIIYFENVFLNNINKIMVSIIIGTTVSSVLIILKISAPVPTKSLFV